MSEYWIQEIRGAQKIKTITINGKEYERVVFGDEKEDWGAGKGLCGDCAVAIGQFHVPNCDVERCPACGGQAISCDCDYECDNEE